MNKNKSKNKREIIVSRPSFDKNNKQSLNGNGNNANSPKQPFEA
jgi:hypothetical protein